MLVTNRYLGMQQDYYFTNNQTAKSIIKLLLNFILFLKNYFNINVKIIKADNEITTVKTEVQRYLLLQGIIIKPLALNTQA